MRVTHIGHACLLIETGWSRLLVDPGTFAGDWDGLENLDAVLVTHAHHDHIDRERLPRLLDASPSTRLYTEPELARELEPEGFRAEAIRPGEAVEIEGTRVSAVGGRHAVIHADIPRIGNIGLVIGADGEPTLFHPGDSYEHAPPGVDVLAVPLNAPWGALKEAIDFTREVGPRTAFPVHDGLLNDRGRQTYLRQLTEHGGTEVRDLRGEGAVELG